MTRLSSDEAVGIGIEVAHAWARQDRLDPHRPTLGQVVAEVVDRRVGGRRATDGADRAVLLDLLAAVEHAQRVHGAIDLGALDGMRAAAARARAHVDRQVAR